jgi:hypothetical protein
MIVWMSVCLAALGAMGCASQGFAMQEAPPQGAWNRAASGAEDAPAGRAPTRDFVDLVTAEPSPGYVTPGEAPTFTAIDPRKLVYEGEFTLLAADVLAAQRQARALADDLGGYLAATSKDKTVLRVPADRFRQAVDALGQLGTVVEQNVAVLDVTEEYQDLTTRLANRKALAEHLRKLLERAEDVKTALEVERELSRVQGEIDLLTGKLKRLANRVAYATLTLTWQSVTQYTPPTLRVKLPIRWLRSIGLHTLMRFDGEEIY